MTGIVAGFLPTCAGVGGGLLDQLEYIAPMRFELCGVRQ